MQAYFQQTLDAEIFLRSRMPEGAAAPFILFIHALGESGVSFLDAFDSQELEGFGLVVPDLPGFGLSTHAPDGFEFDIQVKRLSMLMDLLDMKEVTLVGHAMGAVLALLLARGDEKGRIGRLVNVEGALLPDEGRTSAKAVAAHEQGRFAQWMENEHKPGCLMRSDKPARPSLRRYHMSLSLCVPEAFMTSACELCEVRKKEPGLPDLYKSLEVPSVFCHGDDPGIMATARTLSEAGKATRHFPGAGPWVMEDVPEDFYPFLAKFASKT